MRTPILCFLFFVGTCFAGPSSRFRFENRAAVPVEILGVTALGAVNAPVNLWVPAHSVLDTEIPGWFLQGDFLFENPPHTGITIVFGGDNSNAGASSVCTFNLDPGSFSPGWDIHMDMTLDAGFATFRHTRISRPSETGRLLLALTLGTFFGSLLLLPLRYAT